MDPEGTLRTDCAIRIVDALLVRAAEDFLFCDHGLNASGAEELEYLAADLRVLSNIALVGEQSRHFRIGALGPNDSDGYLAGSCVVRTVESDSGYRITAEPAACLLGQRGCRATLEFHQGRRVLADINSSLFTSSVG